MFNNIFNKKENADKYTKYVKDYLQTFKSGRYSSAAGLFECFFYVNENLQKEIAMAFDEALSKASAKNWYKIAYESRGNDYYFLPQNDNKDSLISLIGSEKLSSDLSDAEWNAVLKIGTFHPNGYFREACLKALDGSDGCLRYYYLRMNDWVKEVRDCSAGILIEYLKACPFYDIIKDLFVLERLYFSVRRSETYVNRVLKIIDERVEKELSEAHLNILFKEEAVIRNSFYKFLCKDNVLSKAAADYIIDNEPYANFKERLFIYKLEKFKCSEQEIEKYIRHKCPNVRYLALLNKYESSHSSWDGIEAFLTDKSSKVRSLAVFILKKYENFEPRQYYLNLLNSAHSEIALIDIGIYGTRDDAETVSEYLRSDKTPIVRKALHSYGRLMGSAGEKIYWNYICSENISLCVEAYRLIAANRIRYGADRIWHEYKARIGEASGKYFLYLLFKEPVFERMEYLLELFCDETTDTVTKNRVYDILCQRSMYAVISAEKAESLTKLIKTNEGRLGGLASELLFDISIARK